MRGNGRWTQGTGGDRPEEEEALGLLLSKGLTQGMASLQTTGSRALRGGEGGIPRHLFGVQAVSFRHTDKPRDGFQTLTGQEVKSLGRCLPGHQGQ